MSKLKKTLVQVYTSGSAGVAGDPGEPPHGAYTITTVERELINDTGYSSYELVHRGPDGNFVSGPGDGQRYVGTGTYRVPHYEDVPRTTYFPASPGRLPVAAVAPTLPGFRNNFNLGWNAGACSIGSLSADGAFEFEAAPSTVGIVAGLNDISTSPAYQEIDFGIYLTQGRFQTVESGAAVGSWMGYAAGDVFRVERVGTRISYAKNGIYIGSSIVPSSGLLIADSSIYSGGDSILNATFRSGGDFVTAVQQGGNVALPAMRGFASDHNSARSTTALKAMITAATGREADGITATVFQPMISRGSNKPYAFGAVKMQQMMTAATGAVKLGVYTSLQPLVGMATNKAYASSTASLRPLVTEAHASEFTPSYAISGGTLVQMTGAGHGLTGEIGNVYVALNHMRGVASDRPYGFSTTRFALMGSYGAEIPAINAFAQLTLEGKFTLVASGTRREPNSFHGMLTSGYQLKAYVGGAARMAMTKPKLQIEASFAVVGRAALSMPMGTLKASGMGGAVGRAGMTMGSPTLRAFAGAVIKATLHDGFALNASARQGGLGRAGDMTMPLFGLVATGVTGGVGKANLTMPMLRAAPSGKALLAMPGFELVAIGHAVVVVSYEAYAVTLNHDADQNEKRPGTMMVNAVTHYTDYPFNQILRFGNKYYGIGDTGIYALEGDTDIGNPISWALETTLSDMGTAQKKRVASASIGGRVTSLLNFTLIVGEAGTERYNYATPRSDAAQNYRQIFGKGVNARYVGFGIADEAGGRFEMDTLDIEHFPLNRSI